MDEFILIFLNSLASLGYVGIAVGLMIEVIPSEIVLGYGGFLVSQEKINFFGAVIAGTIGGTFAQLFLYWAGFYGGRPFLLKYGRYIFIREKHITIAEKWFEKYGPGVIFTARFIPVVRHAISIPAGIAKMSWQKFTFYTISAIVPWTVFFLYIGVKLEENWQHIDEVAAPYIEPVIITSIFFTIGYIGMKLIRKSGK
ncbi:DedA family protein [Calidifontibacillus oryziterrae]|uniref:DedA family protein n=1 Tax=Calidifontibacillus oryziterrae TaxID=1191699 RepID=UPI0002D7FA16|nr:DedA family protein [Calidifontibacillus oryziterrae]